MNHAPTVLKPAPGFTRIPFPFYCSMILQYAVGGALLPFATLYLKDKGLAYSEIGWIYLSCCAAGATTPFLWGYLADRWISVDRLLTLLHFFSAGALVLFANQSKFPQLLVTQSIFFGLYQPTSPLIHALAFHNLHAPELQFARLRLWGSVGWLLPSLPLYLWLHHTESHDLRIAIYLAAAIQILMVAATFFLPRTPPGAAHLTHSNPGEAPIDYRAALKQLLRRPGFLTFLAVMFLMHSSFAVFFYYSAPFLEELGLDRSYTGAVQYCGVLFEIPLFFILPYVIRRFGYFGAILLGCLTIFSRQLIYSASSNLWILCASYVLAGMATVFYLTGVSLALNAMSERPVRATAQTLFSLVGAGLGQMFGHVAVSWITGGGRYPTRAIFYFALATAGAALSLLIFVLRGNAAFTRKLLEKTPFR